MAFHRELTDADIHSLTAVSYADIAARDADTAFNTDTENLNKMVRVNAPVSFYLLGSIVPTWVELSSTELDTLAEVLVNGNTSGGTNLIISAGDDLLVTDHMTVGSVAAPAASASLDLTSITAAMILNRLTTAQRDALTPTIAMQIWNLDVGDVEMYDGVGWVSLGGGDVIGPPSSTDNALMRWNGITGTNAQDSSAILSDAGGLSLTTTLAEALRLSGSNTDGVHLSLDATATDGDEWTITSTGDGNPVGGGALRIFNVDSSAGFVFTEFGDFELLDPAGSFVIAGLTVLFNTAVTGNLGVGIVALLLNTGSSNVAVGGASLGLNVTGNDNTAVGVSALGANTASNNTAIGRNAGRFITGGVTTNILSSTSVYLGAETEALASGDTNEIVIGFGATGIGSNSVTLGNDSILTTRLQGGVTITNAAQADGDELLQLNTARRWAFQQEGSGSGADLRLRNTLGLNKVFFIDTDGSTRWRGQDGTSTFMTINQSTGTLSIGTTGPAASALFEVSSPDRGSLPTPRQTTSQKEAITGPEIALMTFDSIRGRYEFFDGSKWKGLEEAALNIVYFTDESDLPAPVSGQIPLEENTTYVMYNDDPSIEQKAVLIANEFLFPDAGGCRITSIGLATCLLIYTGTGTFFNTTSSFTGFIHIDELFLACPSGTLFNIDGVLPVGAEFFPRLFMSNMGVFDTDTLGTIKNISFNLNVGAFFDCGQGLTIDHTDEALIGDWRFANWKNEAGAIFLTARNQLRFPKVAASTFETGSNETAFNIEPSIGDETFIISTNTYRGAGAAYATGASGTITGVISVPHSGVVTAVAGTPFGESIFTDVAHGLSLGEFVIQTNFINETQYNGTFEVLEIVDADNYRLHVLFTDTDTGDWDSDRIQFAAVNSLSAGDGVQVTGSSVPSYNANYLILGVSGTAFFMNGTDVGAMTGNFNTDSLDETNEPMLVVANAGLASSASTFFGALNGNTTTTTITDGVYAATNWTGLVAAASQRFELTDASIGLWTYTGKSMATGEVEANLSLTKVGASAEYRFALSINGAIPIFATAFHFPAAISSVRSQLSVSFPTGELNTGDTIQLMAAGDGIAVAITISDGSQFLAITES